jgi:hypothetical protein
VVNITALPTSIPVTLGRTGPLSASAGSGRSTLAAAAVKVRLSGTRQACAEAAARLHRLFYVMSVSQPYPEAGNSRLVRVYIKVRLDQRPEPPPTGGPQ